MNDTPKHDEPSMEEILSSIRKIIAEDDAKDDTKGEASKEDEAPKEEVISQDIPPPQEEHKDKPQEQEESKVDVKQEHTMETQNNEEKETPSTLATTEAMVASETPKTPKKDDVLKLTESMVTDEEPTPVEEPTSSVDVQLDVETTSPKPQTTTPTESIEEEFLSKAARQKTSAAFAELGQALKENHKNTSESEATTSISLGKSGQTLEAIVREMLKPMLQEWINANLPKITERMVKQEINKMIARGQ